jgi:hypothetical protein
MNITLHTEPFHYVEIIDLWTEQERNSMFDEMLFLEKKGIFAKPEFSGTARHQETNEPLKQNRSIYLDHVWADREYSDILKHNRKLFELFENTTIKNSWFFNKLSINGDLTLISYYDNSDYYKTHRDNFVASAVSWFFKVPKRFKGGELSFPDYDLTFEVTNNLTILFPSNIQHSVSEIIIDDQYKGKQNGRFCMNQFMINSK